MVAQPHSQDDPVTIARKAKALGMTIADYEHWVRKGTIVPASPEVCERLRQRSR